MDVTNRQTFLACLDQPVLNEMNLFAHAKHQLLAAVDSIGFVNFAGSDYMVMNRLYEALGKQNDEASLWGLAFIDLWFCSNFTGGNWSELVAHDSANVPHAIEAAHWVFAVSGANGAPQLAAILNRYRCWEVAQQYVPLGTATGLHTWWNKYVLPLREA